MQGVLSKRESVYATLRDFARVLSLCCVDQLNTLLGRGEGVRFSTIFFMACLLLSPSCLRAFRSFLILSLLLSNQKIVAIVAHMSFTVRSTLVINMASNTLSQLDTMMNSHPAPLYLISME